MVSSKTPYTVHKFILKEAHEVVNDGSELLDNRKSGYYVDVIRLSSSSEKLSNTACEAVGPSPVHIVPVAMLLK